MSKSAKIIIIVCLILAALTLAFFAPRPDFRNLINSDPQPTPTPPPTKTTLFFAGDIMLSRNVAASIYREGISELPFIKVANEIKKADIAFANLESPFSKTGDHSVEGSLVFNADPDFVKGLTFSGFDILSTANNHSFDQGISGIYETVGLLIDNGIYPVGTPNDCHVGVSKEVNGIKFGFLAYSYAAHNDGGKIPDENVCDWNDNEQVALDIAILKPKVDFLIVSAHMGTEYKREPDPDNAEMARATIDAGADLFIGHHPHWIQTIEEYKGKQIFYSLGNFVFDQMWSQDTKEGLTVTAIFEDKILKQFELKPVIIENYCCPRWATEDESMNIFKKINLTSPMIMNKN